MTEKCRSCETGNVETGCRGESCPIAGFTKPNFKAGCNQHSPRSRQDARPCPTPAQPVPPLKPAKTEKLPNKTEAEYARIHLAGRNAVYEGHTFKMANGHKYTGDWAVYDDAWVLVEVHETKGGWAQFSEQRARLAFDQCRVEFPHVKFVWARKHDEKGWQIK